MANYKIELNGFSFYEYKQLSHEETAKLLKHYHQYKDEESKNRLILSNFKLILSLIKKYHSYDMNEDLFQVGVIGLIKAIDNFNTSYNLKFSTYAVPLIIGEIKKYIRESSMLRIPRSLRDISYKIIQETENYINLYNKEPTSKELSKLLDINEYIIVEAMMSNMTLTSLSYEIQNDGEQSVELESQIASKDFDYNQFNMNMDLNKALKQLSEYELDILNKRYYEGKTQSELADELFVSQAQISRIEKKALSHLKKLMDI